MELSVARPPVPGQDAIGTSDRNGQRPLRVCMVHLSNFPVDSRVQRQAHALAEQGAEIDCICMSGSEEIRHASGVIRLHGLNMRKTRRGKVAYANMYATFALRAARKVAQLHNERRFDVVEVHNMPNFLTLSGLRARLSGTPVVLDVHDTFPELFATKFGVPIGHPLERLMRAEERLGAAFADAVLVVTDEAGERLNARNVGVGATYTVMNSPDVGVFGPPREPVAAPEDGAVRAMYHGGLATRFGIEPLVESFSLLQDRFPDTSLTVCGADHDTTEIVDLVRDRGARNVFIEPAATPFERIPGVLARHHIGIVPTLSDEFTDLLLPVKLLEYIHMGLPVVTSRLPVIEHYFTEREVRFFEPGSASSLAEAVADVITDPASARERALRALERLEDFSWAKQKLGYLEVMNKMAAARRAAVAA